MKQVTGERPASGRKSLPGLLGACSLTSSVCYSPS
ncbi:unnamed protein product [Gulo gulo]|uniref:Uncharacterized protein n=1 Tax=Gulo gulo TaxID=48420 RepID=A0A9X9LJF3_GULGU|nr:unnamed protein product [Gulo gulo]